MIKEETKINPTDLHENDIIYGVKKPRTSCKYCHETGKSGWDSNGDPILCRCLSRTGKGGWITILEFNKICSNRRIKKDEKNNRLDDNSGSNKIHTDENHDKEPAYQEIQSE